MTKHREVYAATEDGGVQLAASADRWYVYDAYAHLPPHHTEGGLLEFDADLKPFVDNPNLGALITTNMQNDFCSPGVGRTPPASTTRGAERRSRVSSGPSTPPAATGCESCGSTGTIGLTSGTSARRPSTLSSTGRSSAGSERSASTVRCCSPAPGGPDRRRAEALRTEGRRPRRKGAHEWILRHAPRPGSANPGHKHAVLYRREHRPVRHDYDGGRLLPRLHNALLLSDATSTSSPDYCKDAVVFNAKNRWGFVADTERFAEARLFEG